MVVADEVDAIEIELLGEFCGFELRGDQGIVDEFVVDERAQQAHEQCPHEGRPHGGGQVLGHSAERSNVAGQLLGGAGHEHIEEQCYESALPQSHGDEAHDHGKDAPVVTSDERQPTRAHRHQEKGGAGNLPRGVTIVEPHDQDRRKKDRQHERHHCDGRRHAGTALHDLNIKRHGKVDGCFHADNHEQRDDGRPFPR